MTMPDQAPQTIDEAIQKFAGYARGENGFDELDLKEYLCDEWLPKMNQLPQTTQGEQARQEGYKKGYIDGRINQLEKGKLDESN